MARYGFTTANYLRSGVAPVTAVPLTIAVWHKGETVSDTGGAGEVFVDLHNSGSASNLNTWRIGALGDGTALTYRMTCSNSASTTNTGGLGTTGPNQWSHVAGIFTSATSRRLVVNGRSEATSATSRAPSGVNEICVGVAGGTSRTQATVGGLQDVAVWNIDLTIEECGLLSAGMSPLRVRPSNLVAYWPLIAATNNSDERPLRNVNPLVVTGTLSGMIGPAKILRNTEFSKRLWLPTSAPADILFGQICL